MEMSCQLHAPAALSPRKESVVPIGFEAEWAPEPVWTLWRTEESVASAGNRTHKPSRHSSPSHIASTIQYSICFRLPGCVWETIAYKVMGSDKYMYVPFKGILHYSFLALQLLYLDLYCEHRLFYFWEACVRGKCNEDSKGQEMLPTAVCDAARVGWMSRICPKTQDGVQENSKYVSVGSQPRLWLPSRRSLELSIKWRQVISLATRTHYPRGTCPLYPFDRRLCGPITDPDTVEKRKIFWPCRESKPRSSNP
jgi:hypothetical protein